MHTNTGVSYFNFNILTLLSQHEESYKPPHARQWWRRLEKRPNGLLHATHSVALSSGTQEGLATNVVASPICVPSNWRGVQDAKVVKDILGGT